MDVSLSLSIQYSRTVFRLFNSLIKAAFSRDLRLSSARNGAGFATRGSTAGLRRWFPPISWSCHDPWMRTGRHTRQLSCRGGYLNQGLSSQLILRHLRLKPLCQVCAKGASTGTIEDDIATTPCDTVSMTRREQVSHAPMMPGRVKAGLPAL